MAAALRADRMEIREIRMETRGIHMADREIRLMIYLAVSAVLAALEDTDTAGSSRIPVPDMKKTIICVPRATM